MAGVDGEWRARLSWIEDGGKAGEKSWKAEMLKGGEGEGTDALSATTKGTKPERGREQSVHPRSGG